VPGLDLRRDIEFGRAYHFGGAAGGLAFINSFAQLGSIVGPYGAGWIKSETGSFQDAMFFMAAASILAAVIAALMKTPNAIKPSAVGLRESTALQRHVV